MARFGLVGLAGFAVDSAALYLALGIGLGLLGGRLFSYLVAATVTWYLHRNLTFKVAARPNLREWLRFLATNALGGAINIAGYSVLVLSAEFFRRYPVVAVGIGAIGGMVVNYLLSSRVVFRDRPANEPPARAD